MKWFTRFGALLALLALVATTLIVRSREGWRAWQALPGGGEVRMLAVTHGTEHSIEQPGPTWRERVRKAWQTRSFRPLAPRPAPPMRTTTKTPSLVFWLEGRNLPGAARSPWALHPDADLVLPDRQAFAGTVDFAGLARTTAQWAVEFPLLPARSERLRLITRWKGAQREFDVPNPAYRTDLPVWEAEPLPQTKRHGDAAFTLRSVNVVAVQSIREGAEALVLWRAQPLWAVTHRAGRGDPFYEINTVFEDSVGNVSRGDGALLRTRVERACDH